MPPVRRFSVSRALFGPLLESETLFVVSTSTLLVMLGQGIAGPILPLFARSFDVSLAAVGLTLSAFAVARMFVNLPSGLVADRWGRRVLLVGGPLVTGIGSLLSATATGLVSLLAWRFVAGVGSAMYMTGAAIVVTDIATDANRGRMLAINQSALLLGVTLGPAVGGTVAEFAGLRAPFVVIGVAAIGAAIWNFIRVPETRAKRDQAPAVAADGLPQVSGLRRSLALALSLNFALIALVSFAVFFARSGRQVVLPLYGADVINIGEGTIGGVFALMAFINLLLTVPAGGMVDRFGVKATIVPSAAVSLVGFVLIAGSQSFVPFVGAVAILAVGSGLLGPAPPAYVAEIAPPELRGTAMGMFRTVSDLGFVIAPPTVGFLADTAGYEWALVLNGLVLVAAATAFWLFATHEPAAVRALEVT
ncbi:MAG: MFS transporter [Dehalococcoidia bacterium]